MSNHYKAGKVINLTRKDFDGSFKLKKAPGKDGLIVFHANWCGFCVQLAPQYVELSKKAGIKLYAVEVDTSGCQDIFEHYQIQGFPSIRFISKNGNIDMENYMGDRDVASMMKYIKEKGTKGGAKKKAQRGGNAQVTKINSLYRKYDELESEFEETRDNDVADERDDVYLQMEKLVKAYLNKGGDFRKLDLSSNWKKTDFVKAQKGGCAGGKCGGQCGGGQCGGAKKKSSACKKCHGHCKGGQCKKAQKGGSIKSVKKAVKKAVKSVKKMIGGRKPKKTIKKRKPAKKTMKKRGKK